MHRAKYLHFRRFYCEGGRLRLPKESLHDLERKFWQPDRTEVGLSRKKLSKFGSTVMDGLHRFEKQKNDLEDCQMIVMNFGGNDSDFLWSEISDTPDTYHAPKIDMEPFIQTYLSLIERVKESGKTPILLSLPPVDHMKYFAWISRELNADNILKWLGGTSEFIYRWHERYNVAVHKIVQTANVKLIDIRSAFLEKRDYNDCLCDDGIHPNAQGHALIAQAVFASMSLS